MNILWLGWSLWFGTSSIAMILLDLIISAISFMSMFLSAKSFSAFSEFHSIFEFYMHNIHIPKIKVNREIRCAEHRMGKILQTVVCELKCCKWGWFCKITGEGLPRRYLDACAWRGLHHLIRSCSWQLSSHFAKRVNVPSRVTCNLRRRDCLKAW